MPTMRMPTRRMAPQGNGNRDWNVGVVSPEDGTPVRLDTDTGAIRDDHGNESNLATMAGNRPLSIVRRWVRKNFPK